MKQLASHKTRCIIRILMFAVSLAAAATTAAETAGLHAMAVSIEGYSPVSYFTKGIAERGSEEFAVRGDGFIYYLASAEQVALFNANPQKYMPRYKLCPYSLARGMTLPLDPTNFKVFGDTLLLFHKSDAMDGLQLWSTAPESDEELLELADKQYVLFKF